MDVPSVTIEDSALLAPLSLENRFGDQAAVGWPAYLRLEFAKRDLRTDLKFRHQGPLRIQKALYPQGPQCCHAVVVHPPGGIAGGDSLTLDISVQPLAEAVVTTPSATKWYGAFKGGVASQVVDIDLQGRLEWLPAETIVFDGAQVASSIHINASKQATMVGWDLLVFGRHGSGERFCTGQFDQRVCISLDGTEIWTDRLRLAGNDDLFDSPIGMAGHHALSTFWAIAPEAELFTDELVAGIRQAVPDMVFTRLHPRLLVGRALGAPIGLDRTLKKARAWIRQHAWLSEASDLRLWAT